MRFLLDPSAADRGAGIDLTTGSGKVGAPALGLPPIAVRRGELRAEVKRAGGAARSIGWSLSPTDFTLGLSGALGEVDGRFQADVKLDATDLDVAEVLQLWPEKVAGEARGWVAGNVTAGQFTAATLRVADQATPDQLDVGGGFEIQRRDGPLPGDHAAGHRLGRDGEPRRRQLGLHGDRRPHRGGRDRQGRRGALKPARRGEHRAAPGEGRAELDRAGGRAALDAEPVALGKATGLSPQAAKGERATKLEIRTAARRDPGGPDPLQGHDPAH